MFTLPVNRDSTVNLTVRGKQTKHRTWTLTTIVQTGININFGDWIPGDQTDYVSSTQFVLDILIDGNVSSSHLLTSQQQTFTDTFIDTDQTTNRSVTFRLTGKTNDAVVNEIHDLVKIKFYIEDLEFSNKIFELCSYTIYESEQTHIGSELLGQNGELTLHLTTPIYTWLLSNDQLILPK